jgi:predicted transcriptional regulator
MPASELTGLIQQIHAALSSASSGKSAEPQNHTPALPIKNSVTPDYIICLEDGRKYKSLKRHLRTSINMTPDEYRAKWGLKRDYPMVAPAYAAQRSKLAKSIGLGSSRKKTTTVLAKAAPAAKHLARKKAKVAKTKKG